MNKTTTYLGDCIRKLWMQNHIKCDVCKNPCWFHITRQCTFCRQSTGGIALHSLTLSRLDQKRMMLDAHTTRLVETQTILKDQLKKVNDMKQDAKKRASMLKQRAHVQQQHHEKMQYEKTMQLNALHQWNENEIQKRKSKKDNEDTILLPKMKSKMSMDTIQRLCQPRQRRSHETQQRESSETLKKETMKKKKGTKKKKSVRRFPPVGLSKKTTLEPKEGYDPLFTVKEPGGKTDWYIKMKKDMQLHDDRHEEVQTHDHQVQVHSPLDLSLPALRHHAPVQSPQVTTKYTPSYIASIMERYEKPTTTKLHDIEQRYAR